MSAEVPQWLVQAFVRSVQATGSAESKDQIAAVCRSLIERWSTPDRSYHGVTHLIYVLTRLETLLPEAREPDLVRLAAWYHGACFSTAEEDTYTHNGGENEWASAKIAQKELLELGVAPAKVERVSALICALGPRGSANSAENPHAFDLDEQTLRDAHLGTLAVEPQRYKSYLARVAEEYAHIPRIDFLRARREIVSRLLSRKQLFVTPLARQWDEPARENLAAELERLSNSLTEAEMEKNSQGDSSQTMGLVDGTPQESEPDRHGSDETAGVSLAWHDENSDMETSDHVRAQEQDSERSSTQELDGPDDQDGGVLDENSTLEETLSPQDDIPGENLQAPEEMRSESAQAQGQPGPERPSAFDSILSASESQGEPESGNRPDKTKRPDTSQSKGSFPYVPAVSASSPETLSSLESCVNKVDPEYRPAVPNTPEAARKARRDQIAEAMRLRIEERHKAADTMRMNRIAAEIKLDDIAPAASEFRDEKEAHSAATPSESHDFPTNGSALRGGAVAGTPMSDPAGSASSRPAPSQPAPRRVSAWERVKEERSPDKVGEDIESRPTHGIEREPDL